MMKLTGKRSLQSKLVRVAEELNADAGRVWAEHRDARLRDKLREIATAAFDAAGDCT